VEFEGVVASDISWLRDHTCTTWSTPLSSKATLPDAIDFGAVGGANLVTQLLDVRGNETLELHRVYLTKCIYQQVLESQLPHKTVNFLFTMSLLYNNLTIWGES